jgi:putative intracellular protease/amidase
MVKDKHVTAFSNSEERAVGLDKVVPFLLEDKLKERGALYSKGPDFSCYLQLDGKLVTGQNPASSGPAAEALLRLLGSA